MSDLCDILPHVVYGIKPADILLTNCPKTDHMTLVVDYRLK